MKLLVIGESFYLTDDDRDKLNFAQGLMKNVIESKCASWDAKSNRHKAWKSWLPTDIEDMMARMVMNP